MNRLYVKDGKDDVLYSDLTINTDFNAVVQQFKVNRGSDDSIQRISGLSENTIVIHKDKSIFLVTGVVDDLSTLVLTLLTNDFGIAGPLAYASMGGDAAFMTKDKRIFTIGQTLEAKVGPILQIADADQYLVTHLARLYIEERHHRRLVMAFQIGIVEFRIPGVGPVQRHFR